MKKRVVIGLSGGVDSSVAAYLLKEEGYEVLGVTMETWRETGDDCSQLAEDARRVADYLGISHQVVDFRETVKETVVDSFMEEYRQGRTPNPCVICNRKVKWEALLSYAREQGADYLATGHYARIVKLPSGRYSLKTSATAAKDQTYALYGLSQQQLSRTLMPVGEYEKQTIRDIARKVGIPVAEKPDSQEICFIPDDDYVGFLRRNGGGGLIPGEFVTREGKVLGQHKGIACYTLGQRRGLELPMGHRVFVTEIRPEKNQVVVGENQELFCERLRASHINFMAVSDLGEGMEAIGKIRYNHRGAPCRVYQTGPDELTAVFQEPQRAITPGQAFVFYTKDGCVAGGGTIL